MPPAGFEVQANNRHAPSRMNTESVAWSVLSGISRLDDDQEEPGQLMLAALDLFVGEELIVDKFNSHKRTLQEGRLLISCFWAFGSIIAS